jgi:hypothetical protein
VFKLTPAGTLTTLHVFEYADGAEPFGGLVQATDGTFYGAAYSGGNFVCDRAVDFPGCGTVYSLSVGLGPFIAVEENTVRQQRTCATAPDDASDC